MKAGIITFHFPYNSGAALQCLALQTVMQQMGHEVSVIDYRPYYHQERFTPKRSIRYAISNTYRQRNDGGALKRCLRALYYGAMAAWFNLFQSRPYRETDRKFRPFREKYLNLTRCYRTLEELATETPDCDCFFSGSDQLWNDDITGGNFDPAYFLTFAPPGSKKVSYAVSVRMEKSKSTDHTLKTLLSGMDTVSIREDKYASAIAQLLPEGTPLRQDIDPTLLLQAADYAPYEAEQTSFHKKGYILTYTMGDASQERVYTAAKKLSSETGLPVIDITGNPLRGSSIFGVNSTIASPAEFLTYVKCATYIVTNSFHGTAFSLIYSKQFAAIPHTTTGNRITDLLNRLELSHRCTESSSEAAAIVQEPIAYDIAAKNLDSMRADSLAFIRSVLN